MVELIKFLFQLFIMELPHNPKHLGNKLQAWKSFLVGSLIMSSFIFFVYTENEIVFLSALGLMIIGFLLFLDTLMSMGRTIYLGQNMIYIVVGVVVSLLANATGYLSLYLVIVFILVLVTWLHKFKVHAKKIKKIKIRKKSSEPSSQQRPI